MRRKKMTSFVRLGMFLLSLSFPAVSLVSGQVPQKIAVLEFTSEGSAPGFDFVSRSIPETIEIELDRAGDLYVIRRYLWESVYQLPEPVDNLAKALQFGIGARIDGVIFGRVKFRKTDAVVTVRVCDVLKGAIIFTNRFVLPLNDSFFAKSESAVTPLVRRVTNSFRSKEQQTIVRERREIKAVYADIKQRSSEFKLTAGYAFSDLGLELSRGSTNMATNVISYHPMNGFSAEASYKWRMIEAGVGVDLSLGAPGICAAFKVRAGAWLFHEIVQLDVKLEYWTFNGSGVRSSILGFVPGIVLKPGDNFSFGMSIGPSWGRELSYVLFNPAGWTIDSRNGMDFLFYYRFNIWRRLEAEFRIGSVESRFELGSGPTHSLTQRVSDNYLEILLSYKLGKE